MYIKQWRKARRITQERLAELMEVHENTIRLWEKGIREPRSSDITKLCAILGCTESDLLNGSRDDKVELVLSWNWEEMKKGEINMNEDKFKLILGGDGRVGLQGAGMITSREAIEDFLSRVRNELEIAFETQVKRGVIPEA